MPQRRSELLGAIDRRLWRDLGFADPEPRIVQFLPMLVVAWSDGRLGVDEADTIRDHARTLPAHLRGWIDDRLKLPPGPYFRYQVAHLLAFLACTWARNEARAEAACLETGQEWANEIVAQTSWFKRVFGGNEAPRRELADLRRALAERRVPATDRIWALARGTHAEGDPERVVCLIPDHDQANQALGIVLAGETERVAVATYAVLTRDDDLDPRHVADLLSRNGHLREIERWVQLAEEVHTAGRPMTPHQKSALDALVRARVGGDFQECSWSELSYLEDALAVDARWCSWVAGRVEELHIDRELVYRTQAPGTFRCPRERVKAAVVPRLVGGPPGTGFRVLEITGPDATTPLRLATPALTQEPPTPEAVQWIARFLPSMCDPYTQLLLDEDGPRWIAEVWPELSDGATAPHEPMLPGRALLVPPWIWFRAADALGVRFFSGRRKGGG